MIINVQSIPAHALVVSPAASAPQCGSNLALTATVSGLGPFNYRWYDNHTNLIAGATNATYTLMNVRAANAGNYTVIATTLTPAQRISRPSLASWMRRRR